MAYLDLKCRVWDTIIALMESERAFYREVSKFGERFEDKVDEIKLRINPYKGGLGCLLVIIATQDDVNIVKHIAYPSHKMELPRHGRIPKRGYRNLLEVLEENDVWNRESDNSMQEYAWHRYHVSIKRAEEKNEFSIYSPFKSIEDVMSSVDDSSRCFTDNFVKSNNIVLAIKELSKFAKRRFKNPKLKDILRTQRNSYRKYNREKEEAEEKLKEHPVHKAKRHGMNSKAIPFCLEALKLDLNDTEALYHLAQSYEASDMEQKAVETWEEYLRVSERTVEDKNVWVSFFKQNLAQAYETFNQRAIEVWEHYLKENERADVSKDDVWVRIAKQHLEKLRAEAGK